MDSMNELDSMCGVSDDELTERFIKAVEIAKETNIAKGGPVQKLDKDGNPYMEYPDGRKVYLDDRKEA